MADLDSGATDAFGQTSSDSGQLRGFSRILAREVNVSDLLQEITTRDPTPWAKLLSWTPASVDREVRLSRINRTPSTSGIADLVLRSSDNVVPVEIKLGHSFTMGQAEAYEAATSGRIILAGLALDAHLIEGRPRWEFLDLEHAFSAWTESSDLVASTLANAATVILGEWNSAISGSLDDRSASLSRLTQNFLRMVVTRKIAADLLQMTPFTFAGVTSGGGLPLVQAWIPVPDSDHVKFIAEVRWERRDVGALRFGVDSWARDSAAVRADSWRIAVGMDSGIRADALVKHLQVAQPDLARSIRASGMGRKPVSVGAWEPVVARGFRTVGNPDGVAGGRRKNNPGFLGDGTRRFQAKVSVDFTQLSGVDLQRLMMETLRYLELSADVTGVHRIGARDGGPE